MNNLIGQHMGPYRILEQIGIGGMATVYKAYQPAMDRYVAVKVIASHFAQDEMFLKRFRREARTVAKLEHAHILPVYDSGEAEGRPYLVMRYLEAGTLKDQMIEGPCPLREVNRIIGQVGSALDYAHRMGVVHRDVKPTNILLDAEGNAFLTDFGLARMMEASVQLTETGVGIGTPAYMSPEQGKGAKVDSRTDVYSLGVMLYEMVTGRAPYEAETPLAVVLKHIQEPLPLPRSVVPDLPEEVERVILRAMAKEPDDRYQTAGEMVRALDVAVRASEGAARTEPAAPAARMEPAVAEVAVEPTQGVLARAMAGVRQVLPAGWGRTAAWVAIGIVALLLLFLALSRVPLRVQISGGQLEVVRVVEGTPTKAAAIEGTPTLTPLPTVSAVPPPAPSSYADRARAFAEPILAAIADRAPAYEDDFSDPTSGWSIGSTTDGDEWGYEDDAYFISATYLPQGGRCISGRPDSAPLFSDFVLELDAQFISGGSGLWGVIFRDLCGIAEPADHYAVGFWPDGHWRMWKNISGNHVELLATDASPVAFGKESETNHLTIIAQGPRIAFYVNGEPLWFFHDESVSRGGIQLVVTNEVDSLLRVRFDNLKVWDISDLELPSAEAPASIPAPPGKIVYVDGKTGNEEIYVANTDGLSERRLTDHPAGDWSPAWSPDGTRIVFTSDRDATHEEGYQLYVMGADGSNLIKLTTRTDRNAKSASWSPDGSRIAFHSYCDLMVINADGSNWTTLVERRENLCPDFPTWAPDGHRIAFRNMTLPDRGPPVQHDIYVVNNDGSGLVKLTTLTSEDWSRHVVWSPDGSQVAFDILADGQERYYTMNSDGSGEPVELPSIPNSWYPWYWPQWGGEAAAQPPAPGSLADQARAFAEPILAAIADLPPDYADDFSNPGSGWPIGADAADGDEWGYEDGAYFILAAQGKGASPDGLQFSDFVLEVDAQFVSGESGFWWVALRNSPGTPGQPANGEYGVGFSPDGSLQLWKNVAGIHVDLLDRSVYASSFKQGFETNHLMIVAWGSQFAVYINGEPFWFVYDESSSTGTILLEGTNDVDDTPLRVRFDNLKVWDISDLELPSVEATPTPSPGGQARAFAEPILAAIADLPPDYEDDFSNPASGWDRGTIIDPTGWEEGERGYVDGEYYIIAPPAELRPQKSEQPITCASGRPTSQQSFSDMVLEFEGRFAKAEGGNWHVNFRQWHDSAADVHGKYEVMFWQEGTVEVARVATDGERIILAQLQGLPVQAGLETNRLRIVAVGLQIAVYVNGEPALFTTDPYFDERYESGFFDLVACNVAGTPLEVHWDNMRLWDISDLELPSAEATSAPTGDATVYGCQPGERLLYFNDFEDGEPGFGPWVTEEAPGGGLALHAVGEGMFNVLHESDPVAETRIAFRVRPVGEGSWVMFFRVVEPSGPKYSLTGFSDRLYLSLATEDGDFPLDTAGALTPNRWTLVEIIWEDRSTLAMQVDGAKVIRHVLPEELLLERGGVHLILGQKNSEAWFDDIVVCGEQVHS